jgi:type IV pilus assembly protein PilE
MSATKSRGFTLIELMIVVAVIAILAIIALPSYLSQVRKTRRSDAIATMNNVVLNEERWRTNCPSYAAFGEDHTVSCPLAGVNFMATPASTYYTFALAGVTATGYTLTAAPIGSQAKDQQFGTTCGTLTITSAASTSQTPAACFGH